VKATKALHNLGQSLWLDNITRDILDNGSLQRWIDELSNSRHASAIRFGNGN